MSDPLVRAYVAATLITLAFVLAVILVRGVPT